MTGTFSGIFLSGAMVLLAGCGGSPGTSRLPTSPDESATGDEDGLGDDFMQLPDNWEFDLAVPVDGQTLSSMGSALSSDLRNIGGFDVQVGSIWVPETQSREYFAYQIPLTPPANPAPIIVLFHQFNASHADVINTSFLAETRTRGWYMLAPLGRWDGAPGNGQNNFGALNAQHGTNTALAWMLGDPSVDASRVYGVGFSMGGGWMASHAARHPGTYSALVNNTGGVALMDTYSNSPVAAAILNPLLGGDPVQVPFEYERISTIVLDLAGQLVPGGNHMALNLKTTPIQSWYSLNDTGATSYLVDQTIQFDAYFTSVGATNHNLFSANTMPGHDWNTIDETTVCDWFDQQAPTPPPPIQGRWLLDRPGTFGLFRFEQDTTGFSDIAFGAFPGNHYALIATNVQSYEIDMVATGLDPAQPFTVFVDAGATDFTFTSASQMPTAVTRNNTATTAWTWNAGVLTLQETAGGTATWAIQ
ncbi:MAG: hypothetical protein GY711_13275 [bacterium]|nr:hypothetical protein [bacterium]